MSRSGGFCLNSGRGFVLLGFGVLLTLSFLIGDRGLNEPDEGRYANIAVETLESGHDWLEPRMSDFGHYDKPPLVYWFAALSFEVFGVNEFSARLPSMIGAWMALAGLGWAAWRLYGRSHAWWSILICATLAQFWILARFLTPDMLLTGWCTLAIAAWVEARHRVGSWRFWGLSSLFWTLAWWTQATPALIPLLGLYVGCWIRGDRFGRRTLRVSLMLPVVLILGMPWYAWMITQHPEWTQFFLGREVVGRVVGHVDGRHGSVFYYLLLSPVAWLPWFPMLMILGILHRKKFRSIQWKRCGDFLGMEGWIVVIGILIFSVISSKLPTYTLILVPWVALMFSRLMVAAIEWSPDRAIVRTVLTVTVLWALLLGSVTVFYPQFESGMGANSTMRMVARTLRERNAQEVWLDRYWSGMEFCFGEQVHYVVSKEPKELSSDSGFCAALGAKHFCNPTNWIHSVDLSRNRDLWIVHYVKQNNSPFSEPGLLNQLSNNITVGHFELARISHLERERGRSANPGVRRE